MSQRALQGYISNGSKPILFFSRKQGKLLGDTHEEANQKDIWECNGTHWNMAIMYKNMKRKLE